jgi:uncharacterized membrane protein
MLTALKNLKRADWFWLNFKTGMFLFVASVLIFPTPTTDTLSQIVVYVWCFAGMLGAVISIAGIILGAQPHDWAHKYGVTAEVGGLILLGLGPLIYWILQSLIVIAHGTNWDQRFGVLWLSYAMTAVVAARLIDLLPRFKREIADMKVVRPHGYIDRG